MTNEEAIEIMNKVTFYWELGNQTLTQNQINEALDMAIKALEQESVLDKIRAEIEQLPTTKCTETHRIYIDADDFKKNVLVILDKYKAESEEEE